MIIIQQNFFTFSLLIFFTLEGLRKPKVHLFPANLEYGVWRVVGLRNQEARRIEQIAVINAEFAANRRFDSESESDGV